MSINLSKLVRDHFNAVEKKDLEVVLGFYHPDINLIDPHYPKVNMKGKNEVIKGLTWSFKTVKSFSFSTINYFENEDGTNVSVEYDSTIKLFNGKSFQFRQVFIIEMKNDKISRLQAYETYGPHGMHKIMLLVTRIIHKIIRY